MQTPKSRTIKVAWQVWKNVERPFCQRSEREDIRLNVWHVVD